MGGAQWLLELVLVLLLAATLFHAVRLERALGVLKRDRAVLEGLVEGFNESTRQAEDGIERLRSAADGAGRQLARQIEQSQRLRDDLSFLAERGDRLAERLEGAVRSARMVADTHGLSALPQQAPFTAEPEEEIAAQRPSGLHRFRRRTIHESGTEMVVAPPADPLPEGATRLRSQAERDLLRALRAGR